MTNEKIRSPTSTVDPTFIWRAELFLAYHVPFCKLLKISGSLKSVAEHATKVVSFVIVIFTSFLGSRHISAVRDTRCANPLEGRVMHIALSEPLSRRVPLPVLNGVHVRQVGRP